MLIEQIDVLAQLYGQVMIPDGVKGELDSPYAPITVKRWIQAPPAWLEIRTVRVASQCWPATLGLGEVEAMQLAQDVAVEQIILDDRLARV